jgi:hypothetical protein
VRLVGLPRLRSLELRLGRLPGLRLGLLRVQVVDLRSIGELEACQALARGRRDGEGKKRADDHGAYLVQERGPTALRAPNVSYKQTVPLILIV